MKRAFSMQRAWAAVLAAVSLASLSQAAPAATGTEVFRLRAQSVVRILCTDESGATQSSGSGSIVEIGKAGALVLTNHHVVDGCARLVVGFKAPGALENSMGSRITGVLLRDEPSVDLAIIRLAETPQGTLPIPLGDTAIARTPGEKVFAIGHPLSYEWSLTEGSISGFRPRGSARNMQDAELIQTQTPISPGNSGGPLLDGNGLLLGVNTFHRVDGQNMNFAVSVTEVRGVLDRTRNQMSSGEAGSVLDTCSAGCVDREATGVMAARYVHQFSTAGGNFSIAEHLPDADHDAGYHAQSWWRIEDRAEAGPRVVRYWLADANCDTGVLQVSRGFSANYDVAGKLARVEAAPAARIDTTNDSSAGERMHLLQCAIAGVRGLTRGASWDSASMSAGSRQTDPIAFRGLSFGIDAQAALQGLQTPRCSMRSAGIHCDNVYPCTAERNAAAQIDRALGEFEQQRAGQITTQLYAENDRKARGSVGGVLGGIVNGVVGGPNLQPRGKPPTLEEVTKVLDADPAMIAARQQHGRTIAQYQNCAAVVPNWSESAPITFAEQAGTYDLQFGDAGLIGVTVSVQGGTNEIRQALVARYGAPYLMDDAAVWLPPGGRIALSGQSIQLRSSQSIESAFLAAQSLQQTAETEAAATKAAAEQRRTDEASRRAKDL